MRKYLLRPDKPDERDFRIERYFATKATTPETPLAVDLREYDAAAIFDQGHLGSCASNAACGLMSFLDKKFSPIGAYFNYARLFNYWKTREIQGTIDYDSGATIRDTMKVMHQIGCAGESTMPYVEADFRKPPTQEAYDTAAFHRLSSYIASYWRIMTVQQLKQSLAEGYPVMMGVEIYSNFESVWAAASGIIEMPNKYHDWSLGGHALLAMGYKMIDDEEYIICRNSWGADWGDKGYCYVPMAFIGRYVTDMWTGR